MAGNSKTLEQVRSGIADASIKFRDLRGLLRRLGFAERIRGDTSEGVEEIINLQPVGAMAKPYQVKQVRQLIFKYRLRLPQ